MRAGYVAERLGVSVQTVRSWSVEFSDFLAPGARRTLSATGGQGQRRYVDADLALFEHVKAMLGQGLTFEEARRQLQELTPEERAAPPVPTRPPSSPPESGEASAALVVGDLFRALAEAHRGEVEALRVALAQAVARAERAEGDLDELRAQLAAPALPPPEQPETPALSPADPLPVTPSPSPSWWETVKRWFNPPETP